MDKATFVSAKEQMAEALEGGRMPERFLVVPSERDVGFFEADHPIDLAAMPDLSGLRKELMHLRNDLIESYDPNRGTEDEG